MDNNKYKLYRIGWSDAIENLEGWHTEDEAIDWADTDNWIVHQVGWIMKETDEYILLFSRYNPASNGRANTYAGLFKIPKHWLLYRIEITQ